MSATRSLETVTLLPAGNLKMRFFVPEVDGIFGENTLHAVMAFQKSQRLSADGVVGPLTRAALADPNAIVPQVSGPGRHVEVDIARQILFFVWNDQVTQVFDIFLIVLEVFNVRPFAFAIPYSRVGSPVGIIGIQCFKDVALSRKTANEQ